MYMCANHLVSKCVRFFYILVMQTPYSLITNQSITDSLIRVPTHDKAEVTEEFNQRLQSLLSCENRLPYLNTASAESQVRQLL